MSKILTAGLSALFITVSSLAYAQTPREEAREAARTCKTASKHQLEGFD
jgi:hypothetical protein